MTGHFAFAFIVLAYLLIPLVAYFVYLVWRRLRRGEADGESEGET